MKRQQTACGIQTLHANSIFTPGFSKKKLKKKKITPKGLVLCYHRILLQHGAAVGEKRDVYIYTLLGSLPCL